MKKVTICFSFLGRDGRIKRLYRDLNTMIGLSGAGVLSTESRKIALKSVFLLLEQVAVQVNEFSINLPTLSECLRAIPPDDLNTEIPTHAKGE